MKVLRIALVAIVLFSALAIRAVADDNWLLGTWATAAGTTYTFTESDVTLKGPNGAMGPFKNVNYGVDGETITVTADGLPGKAVVKKSDDTHASLDSGDGNPVALTKQ